MVLNSRSGNEARQENRELANVRVLQVADHVRKRAELDKSPIPIEPSQQSSFQAHSVVILEFWAFVVGSFSLGESWNHREPLGKTRIVETTSQK